MSTTEIISRDEFLKHWQGHRTLTRKTIEAFPESEIFKFSIAGMRVFGNLIKELLSIGAPGLDGIVHKKIEGYSHELPELKTKSDLLEEWDRQTVQINELFNQIPDEQFHESFNLFGEYEFPVYQNLLYFVDNEIHHRAQGFVYLRALGIEPPFFWDR